MALTKVSGGILDPGINVAGIVTATGFDGPFTGGSGRNITAGIITATELDLNGNGNISGNLIVQGNLTANGDFTTLNTTLREVELLRVDADSNAVAGIITQRGAGDILNLYDDSTEVLTVINGGRVGVGTIAPTHVIHSYGEGNVGGVRLENSHSTTTVSGNTAATAFPHNLILSNYSGLGSADDRIASIGFDVPTTGAYANATIAYQATGAGTGDLQFHLESGNVISEKLRITSGGLVGIGTVPASGTTLDIDASGGGVLALRRNSVSTSNKITLSSDGTDGTLDSTNDIIFRAGGDQRARIDSDGKVGIGTASPSQMLTVRGTILKTRSDSGTGLIYLQNDGSQNGQVLVNQNGGVTRVQLHSSGDSYFNGGNVGIGSAIPSQLLDIGGNTTVASNGRVNIYRPTSGSTNTAFQINSDVGGTDTTQFIIQAGGAVGIGTDNPTAQLEVRGSGSSNTLNFLTKDVNKNTVFYAKDGGQVGLHYYPLVINQDTTDTATPSGTYFYVHHSSSPFIIKNDGKVGIGSAIPSQLLDIGGNTTVASNGRVNIYRPTSGSTNTAFQINSDVGGTDTTQFIIQAGGAVGIGTDNPTAQLEVRGSGSSNTLNFLTKDVNKNTVFYAKDGGQVGLHYYPLVINQDTTDTATPSGTYFYVHHSSSPFIIKNDGKVGIGTDNPQKQLQILGDADTCLRITSSSNGVASLQLGDVNDTVKGAITFKSDDNSLRIRGHNNDDRIIITSGGKAIFSEEIETPQDYPNFRPTLDFNFAATKKLDPRLEYQRTGTASFVNEFGKVVLVGDNSPRFDHDPITRESKGLLIEEERTNYQPYSVDMSQGANNNGVTVTNNQAIAPDGTLSASKITGGTDQNTSQRLGWNTQGVNSSTHTQWSIWVKSEETSCIVQIYSNTYTFGADHMNIELADGSTQGSTIDANFRFSIEEYPNKWWKISWGGVGNASGSGGGMYLAVVPSMSSTRAANTGSAHSKVWYAWGLQEEVAASARFTTSYIPTYGTTATRGRDELTMSGSDLTDVFNNEEGTMFYEASLGDLTNDNQPIAVFRDVSGTTSDYHAMGFAIGGSNPSIRTWFRANGGNEHLSAHTSTGLTANMFYKHIYGYKDADCADAYRTPTNSGILSNQVGNGSPMIASGLVDELRFGGYYAYESQPVTYGLDAGHIKRFSYWPQKLTNSQLTTYIS